jgi:hypothetical protein
VIFDRPTYVDLHVRLTATRKDSGQAIDLDAIKNAIADKTFAIGDSQQSGDLYSYAYQGGNTFILTALEISDDGTAWTDGLLISGYDEKFRLDTANISITEVI